MKAGPGHDDVSGHHLQVVAGLDHLQSAVLIEAMGQLLGKPGRDMDDQRDRYREVYGKGREQVSRCDRAARRRTDDQDRLPLRWTDKVG